MSSIEQSPASQRLLAAADAANAAGHVWAMQTIRRLYQLAVRWQATPGREEEAAELLAVLDLDPGWGDTQEARR